MSTLAVSNLSIFQELQSFYQDRRTDIRQLGSALQAGDLNQAQQVYNSLAALGQSGPFSNSEPFSKSDRVQAFEAIGQALQSGNLADAQAAFSSLQQTFGNHNSAGLQLPAFIVNLSARQNSGAAQDVSSSDSIYQQRREFRQERKTDLAQLGQALQSGNADDAQQAYDALVALGQSGPFRNAEPFQRADRAQDFAAIGQALQSGDLAGAQHAFTALSDTFTNHNPHAGPVPLPPIFNHPAVSAIAGIRLPHSTSPPVFVNPPVTTIGGIVPPHSTSPPITRPPAPTFVPPSTVVPPDQPPSTVGARRGRAPEIIINVGGSTVPSDNTSEIVVNLPKPSNTPEEVQINLRDSHGSGGQLTVDVSQQSANGGEQVALNFNPGSSNHQVVLNLFDTESNNPAPNNSVSLQA